MHDSDLMQLVALCFFIGGMLVGGALGYLITIQL